MLKRFSQDKRIYLTDADRIRTLPRTKIYGQATFLCTGSINTLARYLKLLTQNQNLFGEIPKTY